MASPGDEPSPSLDSPSPPTSPDSEPSSPQATQTKPPASPRSQSEMSSATVSNMSSSSTPLGNVNAARKPPGGPPSAAAAARGGANMNPDIAARMKAFTMGRQGPAARPPGPTQSNSQAPGSPAGKTGGPAAAGGVPAGFQMPPHLNRPGAQSTNSSPAVPGQGGRGPSLAEKRGMRLPGGLPGQAPPAGGAPGAPPGRKNKPGLSLSQMGGGAPNGEGGAGGEAQPPKKEQTQMEKYSEFIDSKTGTLKFKGKAELHGGGVEFSSGRSFSISLDEVDTLDELGKGNYGTVYKVRHSRPHMRKVGQGLAGNKTRGPNADEQEETNAANTARGGTTGVVMAMKEIRLELDEAKFAAIIMELDILHRCISPRIVDFYGAFFQEGAVYICMEFMNGGSIDKIYGDGIPENILRKITLSTVQALKALKEEHNIIHRDVKPTNILINTRGQVKICDFGVSGNLVASIAKTNIGCQSYMAPERISNGGVAQAGANPGGGTYSVQSDIWSLGLTIIECALGRYPYPPETYDNIFSQLQAIVDGDPPDLPVDEFSEAAHNFVAGCLNKIPKLRPTYAMLLQHAWLAPMQKPDTISEGDEEEAAAEAAAEGHPAPSATDATGKVPASGNQPTAENKAAVDLQAVGNDGAPTDFLDEEMGKWVLDALDKRKKGTLGKSRKPALHAAPLDSLGSPGVESPLQTKGGGKDVKPVAVDA
ncbi:hypothetical protein MBLNU230_g7360t1 [Neophaeotheca triangularis]